MDEPVINQVYHCIQDGCQILFKVLAANVNEGNWTVYVYRNELMSKGFIGGEVSMYPYEWQQLQAGMRHMRPEEMVMMELLYGE
jgi:hypothetical protein